MYPVCQILRRMGGVFAQRSPYMYLAPPLSLPVGFEKRSFIYGLFVFLGKPPPMIDDKEPT